VIRHWKRWRITTDSSVEESPEIEASSEAELTVLSGNGHIGRLQCFQSARTAVRTGFAREAIPVVTAPSDLLELTSVSERSAE
jgi:hypothetical protein